MSSAKKTIKRVDDEATGFTARVSKDEGDFVENEGGVFDHSFGYEVDVSFEDGEGAVERFEGDFKHRSRSLSPTARKSFVYDHLEPLTRGCLSPALNPRSALLLLEFRRS